MLHSKTIRLILGMFIAAVVYDGFTFAQSAPPSNLKVNTDGNVVHLTWQAPETNAKVTYNIYRAQAQSLSSTVDPTQLEFSKLSSVIETSYEDKIDEGTDGGQLYVYFIVAVNSEGMESAGSNYVNVKVGGSQADNDMNKY